MARGCGHGDRCEEAAMARGVRRRGGSAGARCEEAALVLGERRRTGVGDEDEGRGGE